MDYDANTGHYLMKAKIPGEIPPELWPIAADALNNLRAALDQGVCASVRTLDPDASLNGLYFPFGDSEAHLGKSIAKIAPRIHSRVVGVIINFLQPRKGGNDRLWALKNLTNANKHRALITFGAAVDNIEISTLELPGPGPILRPYWDRVNNEIVISRTTENVQPRYDLNVSFYIAFGDIEGLSGQPVIQAIDYLSAIVSAFLTGLESDMGRIAAGETL
jgi:hypothetical protein